MDLISQDKPPVAVDDTIYFPVSYEPPYEIFTINPLGNDYSQEMHPIKIAITSAPNAVINDSSININNFWLQEDDTITYVIRDEVNGLISEPGNIYFKSINRSLGWLDINNISARINATSNHFSRYDISGLYKYFVWPKYSAKYSLAIFKPWLSAYDEMGKLRISPCFRPGDILKQKYRSGPMSSSHNLEYKMIWDRVWRISQEEITYHMSHFQDSDYLIPEVILNWPGNGDTNYGHAWELAPYMDIDQDNIYEPLDGEYPLIKGDQAIYFISNDDRGEHSGDSAFFGIEIQGMAYAYDCLEDSIFYNTMFIDYDFLNRSIHNYSQVYLGFEGWLGLGYPYDNYTGCDTSLHTYYVYNMDNMDTSQYAGFSEYGSHPPALGICFLNNPLKHFTTYYQRYSSYGLRPTNHIEMDHYLRGRWDDGSPFTYGETGYGGNQVCDHTFTGNPADPTAWSMISANIDPWWVYNSIASTGPFDLAPEDTISIELAITIARDYGGDNLSSLNLLLQRITDLRSYYNADSIPCSTPNNLINPSYETTNEVNVYPNPFTTSTTISYTLDKPSNVIIQIFNSYGQLIEMIDQEQPQGEQQFQWNAEGLLAGMYYFRIQSGDKVGGGKMVLMK